MATNFPTPWPEGKIDPAIAQTFLDGARAGLAASAVATLMFWIAHSSHDHDTAWLAIWSLRVFALGLALGPLFAWITRRLGFPLLPLGLLFALALATISGELSLTGFVPVATYGITIAITLRHVREGRAATP